jgi:hypothetical protein
MRKRRHQHRRRSPIGFGSSQPQCAEEKCRPEGRTSGEITIGGEQTRLDVRIAAVGWQVCNGLFQKPLLQNSATKSRPAEAGVPLLKNAVPKSPLRSNRRKS